MNQVTVQEVQQHLLELLKTLNPGEAVQIVAGEQVVGWLVAEEGVVARAPRQPGSAVGTLTIVADDDEHLQDFANYMPNELAIGRSQNCCSSGESERVIAAREESA
ncbi:hypothetical protein XM38_027900 [Halomicronema hongdechloris C2206]|uniref:DUF2281 domain-containing protein n=1 Tax=Halomicronema hongdechloris C2206 TaxID=1641165 RepID=A0A1Z3HNI8_9CYAN|nr:antitoxin of toxin-antitoxin stability system [Halomicronema hongdechloris]ASC71836.1 hypothetical protein XM38_027900 [Halomicronema hongdechloris C2206]